jgi:hypothetical protein
MKDGERHRSGAVLSFAPAVGNGFGLRAEPAFAVLWVDHCCVVVRAAWHMVDAGVCVEADIALDYAAGRLVDATRWTCGPGWWCVRYCRPPGCGCACRARCRPGHDCNLPGVGGGRWCRWGSSWQDGVWLARCRDMGIKRTRHAVTEPPTEDKSHKAEDDLCSLGRPGLAPITVFGCHIAHSLLLRTKTDARHWGV